MVEGADINRSQEAIYRDRFLAHGDTPQGVFWNDEETQKLRFERLVHRLFEHAPADAVPSVHEVGAGTAALHGHLRDRGIEHCYSGNEIVKEMIRAASEKYPGLAMCHGDFLETAYDESFDFVVLSGVLNLRSGIEAEAWEANAHAIIRKMFELCRKGIAFNFLTSDITVDPDPELHYFDPREMAVFCQKHLSRFVMLDQSYPLFEVTMTVLKPACVASQFGDAAFAKYFPK